MDRAPEQQRVREKHLPERRTATRRGRRAEDELRETALPESEEQFRTLADAIPQMVWIARADGWVFWFNSRWYDFTGLGPDEMRGWGWRRAHHPDHVSRVVASMHRSFATGEPWLDTFPLRGKDGEYRWFLARALPVRGGEGRITHWFGTNTDITEYKQFEARLLGSEARLRALIECSPLGITIMDLKGNPIFYSPKSEELHGISLAEAGGDGWLRAVHPEDRERIATTWYEAASTGQPWAATYRFVHGDGSVVRVSCRAAPMWIEGRLAGFVATLADITERERLLAGEREARAQAARATRQHDEMLDMVTHNLRTPLHAIMMSTATMLKVSLTDDQRAQVLTVMQRSAQSMERLIRDLLDVTRIELGKFVVEHMRLEVRSLLDATCEQFEPAAREREISVTCEAPPGIPAVIGDRDRLMQVLSSLVGNSLKLTPPRGRVSLRARLIDGHVEISVENTGRGIAPDKLPHLFDRFSQANRTPGDGAGLQLAIAKGIVEAHRGRIWAESVPGHGATFYFTVPNPVVRVADADAGEDAD